MAACKLVSFSSVLVPLLAAVVASACGNRVDVSNSPGMVDSIGPATFDGTTLIVQFSTWDAEGDAVDVIAEASIGGGEFGPIGVNLDGLVTARSASTPHALRWTSGDGFAATDSVVLRLYAAERGSESAAALGPFVPVELDIPAEPRPAPDATLDASDAGSDAPLDAADANDGDGGDTADAQSDADAPSDVDAAADTDAPDSTTDTDAADVADATDTTTDTDAADAADTTTDTTTDTDAADVADAADAADAADTATDATDAADTATDAPDADPGDGTDV